MTKKELEAEVVRLNEKIRLAKALAKAQSDENLKLHKQLKELEVKSLEWYKGSQVYLNEISELKSNVGRYQTIISCYRGLIGAYNE